MKSQLRLILRGLSSLKLTIVLMAMLMVLIFVATLDQVNLGIYFTKKRYFEGLFVVLPISDSLRLPVFPSGLTLGTLLLINLIVAHLYRFKFTMKKLGIWLTHVGLIVLILGAGMTSFMAIESQLSFREGESAQYTESQRSLELVFIETEGDTDRVTSIPLRKLKTDGRLENPGGLPVSLRVRERFANSQLVAGSSNSLGVDSGLGMDTLAIGLPLFTSDNLRNIVSLVLQIEGQGKSLGTWLFSNGLNAYQTLKVGDRSFDVILRQRRYYNDFALTLLDFSHDTYEGTEIPRNFSSKVRIEDPEHQENREVLIYMNHPLRYKGKTYYQASFGDNDRLSILQVVENPGWLFPYISSGIISLGLTIHFMMYLLRFLRKRKS